MQVIKAVHLANLDPKFKDYYIDGQQRVWSFRSHKVGFLLKPFDATSGNHTYAMVSLGGKQKSLNTLVKFAAENWKMAEEITISGSEEKQKDRHMARQYAVAMVDDKTGEMVIMHRDMTKDDATMVAQDGAESGSTMALLKIEGICRIEKKAAWV